MARESPYRAKAEPAPSRAAPAVFELTWQDAERRFHGGHMNFALWGTTTASVAAVTVSPWLALVTLGLGAGLTAMAARATRPAALRVEVHDEVVRVVAPDGATQRSLPLGAVRDLVVLRKGIQRVVYGQAVGDPMPHTTLSPEVDIARIAFVTDDGGEHPLTTSYASYSECMERFGRLRVFLRKQGWLPADERG